MHGEGTTGGGGNIRPSLRNGFTAYTRSPRGPGFLAPVARTLLARARIANLTSASGGQDHTISPSAEASAKSARPAWYRPAGFSGGSGTASLVARHRRSHRIPPPTSVTTAKRPSCGGGTGEEKHKLPKNRSKIFFARGLDSRISVELICEFGFFAHAMLPVEAVARRARPRRDRLISRSSGKSVA